MCPTVQPARTLAVGKSMNSVAAGSGQKRHPLINYTRSEPRADAVVSVPSLPECLALTLSRADDDLACDDSVELKAVRKALCAKGGAPKREEATSGRSDAARAGVFEPLPAQPVRRAAERPSGSGFMPRPDTNGLDLELPTNPRAKSLLANVQ